MKAFDDYTPQGQPCPKSLEPLSPIGDPGRENGSGNMPFPADAARKSTDVYDTTPKTRIA